MSEDTLEREKIGGLDGVVRYVLIHGNPLCNHNFSIIASPFENYAGQCRICSRCGRVETWPDIGEVCEFHGISGKYVLQDNGTPGPRKNSS